jgi:hypothetical protein
MTSYQGWVVVSGGIVLLAVSLIAPEVSLITLLAESVVEPVVEVELPQAKTNMLSMIARQTVIHSL